MAKAAIEKKPLGLYIHIPFCRSKCEYCDFYSLAGGASKSLMPDYQKAVIRHLREAAERVTNYRLDTIYFGGGTPSFYGADSLKELLDSIRKYYDLDRDAEITLEANPDSVTQKSLSTLRRVGFNRISIGVQSDNDDMLKALGRPHSFEQAKNAITAAREAGFENLSVDLIYGLPNQTREGWAGTLQSTTSLKPDHISCYGLKIEPGTRLYEYKDCINLPDDDMQADMYLYAVETLEGFGYKQYEISNFARDDMASKHNLKYWMSDEYLGIGVAAASDVGGRRFTCVRDIEAYINGINNGGQILSEVEDLPLKDRAGEYLMLRLRTTRGFDEQEYRATYLMSPDPLREALEGYAKNSLALEYAPGKWRLTPPGFLVSNTLISELLEVQAASIPNTRRYSA